jgi:hypothetical protein
VIWDIGQLSIPLSCSEMLGLFLAQTNWVCLKLAHYAIFRKIGLQTKVSGIWLSTGITRSLRYRDFSHICHIFCLTRKKGVVINGIAL